VFGGVSGLTIANNVMQNGAGDAIKINDGLGGTPNPNSGIAANNNSISGYAGNGINLIDGYTGTLDAQLNWWGSATGPTIASNPGGTGAKIGDPGAQVDFTPFLTDGTDAQPGTPGFQPSDTDLSVTLSDSVDPTHAGSTLVYTILVRNNGATAAQSVVLS